MRGTTPSGSSPTSRESFHTILLDAPGFGESEKFVSRNGVPLDVFFAEHIVGLMDLLGIERAHLHASSAYGPSIIRFALTYPERVGKLILAAASIGAPVPDFPERGRGPGLESLTTFSNNPTRENMAATMQYFNKRAEFRTDEIIDMRFEAATRPGVIESRLEMGAASNSDLSALLPELRCETLVLWGNEDGVTYVDGALRTLHNVPNSRAVIFGDQSGHFVFMEHPEECARTIKEFLLS